MSKTKKEQDSHALTFTIDLLRREELKVRALTKELADTEHRWQEYNLANVTEMKSQAAEVARLRMLIVKACGSILISPDLAGWLLEEAAKGPTYDTGAVGISRDNG